MVNNLLPLNFGLSQGVFLDYQNSSSQKLFLIHLKELLSILQGHIWMHGVCVYFSLTHKSTLGSVQMPP